MVKVKQRHSVNTGLIIAIEMQAHCYRQHKERFARLYLMWSGSPLTKHVEILTRAVQNMNVFDVVIQVPDVSSHYVQFVATFVGYNSNALGV